MKRVTDPLDDKARARIVGSEHSAPADDDDVISPSLSELFFGFGFVEAGGSSPETDRDRSRRESSCENVDFIKPILQDQNDAFKNVLRAHILRAAQIFSSAGLNKQILRSNVMAYLRNFGYNAAICRTKWDSSGGLTAGNYEFIDVARPNFSARYFVDLDFAAEFEIARQTKPYTRLLQQLPRIFVGTTEDFKQILEVVCDAERRSLKSRGLHMPPWRKQRFMQNKWLGPYRRTTNIFPASFSSLLPAKQSYSIKCRAVGFDAAVDGGHSLLPTTARSR